MAPGEVTVRAATVADLGAVAEVYSRYVLETAYTFVEEPPTEDDWVERHAVEFADGPHHLVVAERDGAVAGYAHSGTFRAKSAYRFTVEVTVYVDMDAAPGVGSPLYRTLLPILADAGYHSAVAVISLPNPRSIAFHERHGFEQTGVLREVGYKFGRWHDTANLQRLLRASPSRT